MRDIAAVFFEGFVDDFLFDIVKIVAVHREFVLPGAGGGEEEVLGPKLLGLGHDNGSLDGVLEFANIPRPVVLGQARQG